jgi:hypothetical protein
MSSAAAVVACALFVLGRSEASMPRIELVSSIPIEASERVEAYVRESDATIYLVTSSPAFVEAQSLKDGCTDSQPIKKLASILAHEEWHVRKGPDEKAAYEAQLTTLIRLGIQPGTAVYAGVVKSMQAVLKKQKRKPDLIMAGTR